MHLKRTEGHPTLERFSAIVGFLMKQPRTTKALHELLGVRHSGNGVLILLDALRAEGAVYICEWQETGSAVNRYVEVYAWQPSICHFADAKRPIRR